MLAWNTLGHALLAGHLDFRDPDDPVRRPNMSRMLFLDLHCQELYADWKRKARAGVGNLRIAVGRYPEDALLAELIRELSMKSPEFVGQAPEPVADQHQVVVDAAVLDLGESVHPVLGALVAVAGPQLEDVAPALGRDGQGDINGPVGDRAVADFHVDGVMKTMG